MISYTIRRVLSLLPVLLGITVISFGVRKMAPGKPTDAAMQFNPKASLEARQRIEEMLGLDQPAPVQYARWLRRLTQGDFGRSFLDGRDVSEKLLERLPVTLTINFWAIGLVFLLAVPLGVLAAARPLDRKSTRLNFSHSQISYAVFC